MPEGDTIHRTARTLRRVLGDRELRAARSPLPGLRASVGGLVGRRVVDVEARGKNLLLRFDHGAVLYSHMRMSGSWHVYPRGEVWRKPERLVRLVLQTDEAVAVCFSAPVLELLTPWQARHHPVLGRLGPDLLAADFDAVEARRRLRARGDLPIGVALLGQSSVAGIGNVYKSEVLFLGRVDPFAPVSAVDDATLDRLLDTARGLMSRNLDGLPRRTRSAVDGGRYFVYRRRGRPCRHCGTRVAMRRQGEAARSTYYCPRCQGVRPAGAGSRRRLDEARP